MSNKLSKQVKLDKVFKVITGKFKGQEGKCIKFDSEKSLIWLENINQKSKHIKDSDKSKSQIAKIESPLHLSNVKLAEEK